MFYQQQYHSQGINFLEPEAEADEEAMLIDEQHTHHVKKPMPESPLNKLFTKVAAAQQQASQKHNFQQPQKQHLAKPQAQQQT